MSDESKRLIYAVNDINRSVRRTNVLIRSINGIRLTIRDIQEVAAKPTFANIFWTLVQLSRSYNAVKRMYRLCIGQVNEAANMFGWMKKIPVPPGPPGVPPSPPTIGFGPMALRVDAFRENLPMGLGGLDLSMIPEESMAAIQRVLEFDAPLIVEDAKRILNSRIIYRDRSTGDLEGSINWMPETNGIRVYAGMPYGWWVERGQRSFTGHWYLRDATDEARLRIPQKIRDELNRLINQKG